MLKSENIMFPSPVGELHFSILKKAILLTISKKFPSPVGELHFSITGNLCSYVVYSVSVPCRGTTFLNCYDTIGLVEAMYKHFRPLSGNYISQLLTVTAQLKCMISVPCRGTTFLNTVLFLLKCCQRLISVPCRGTTFLNK